MPHLDNPSFLEELEDKHSEKIMDKVEKHIDNHILGDISFKELHKLARNMLLVEWFNKSEDEIIDDIKLHTEE